MSQATEQIVRTFAFVVAAGITLDGAEPASLEQALRDCAQSAAFIESVRLRAIARLDEHVTIDTNQTIITTSHGSKRQAQTVQKRAATATKMPALANALANGTIGADHVDAVAQTLARMEPADREKLAAEQTWITATAARTTPEQLTKTLQRRARELSSDDGRGLPNDNDATPICASGQTLKAAWSIFAASSIPRPEPDGSGAYATRQRCCFTIGCPTPAQSTSARTTIYAPSPRCISPRARAADLVDPTSPLSSTLKPSSRAHTRTPESRPTGASRFLSRPSVGWRASPTSSRPCLAQTA